MSFDWTDYFKLAEALNREKGRLASSEACQRSSISRAYYAVFHLAWDKALALDNFQPMDDSQIHKEVRLHYQRSHDARRQLIGTLLDRMRNNRNKADYDNTVLRLDSMTAVVLIDANDCIKGVGSLERQV